MFFGAAIAFCSLCLPIDSDAAGSFETNTTYYDFKVQGLIREKYDHHGGAGGVLGKPTGEETTSADGKGKYQQFEHGSIAFSPSTGPKSMQVLYLQGNQLHFEWGNTAPFNYDLFQVRYDLDGKLQGQDEISQSRSSGSWTKRITLGGRYRVVVQGGDRKTGGSSFKQGWSNPVYVQYSPESMIAKRHKQLGGDKGILGKATSKEMDNKEGKGRYQQFEHGALGWTPAVGIEGVQALYVKDGNLILEWGNTKPFNYDFFQVRCDLAGRDVKQDEISGSRTSGRWTFRPDKPGHYRVVVQGGDRSAGGSKFRQGWSAPLYIDYVLPPLIALKHKQMGGDTGPLGKATGSEIKVRGAEGRYQAYEHGMIAWSPSTGARSLQVLYENKECDLIFEWSDTSPFNYDFFQVRYDLNGTNIGQDEIKSGSRTSGRWVRKFGRTGRYQVTVQGGDTHKVGGSTFHQGWSVPISTNYTAPPSRTVSTPFKAAVHGFHFKNDFVNKVDLELFEIKTKGRCGGMAYASLDYFYAKQPVPKTTTLPKDGDPLAEYILIRQANSFVDMGPKFVEKIAQQAAPSLPLGIGPGKTHVEMFQSGVDYIDGIVISIDKGTPIPVGLLSMGVSLGDNHQVLAIGYETSPERQLRRVHVYDSNHPDKTTVLTPDPEKACFVDDTGKQYRTLFSMGNYKRVTPPR